MNTTNPHDTCSATSNVPSARSNDASPPGKYWPDDASVVLT